MGSSRQSTAGALEALSEAIEAGAGLPAVARAAARALGASVALIDRSSTVLAVAARSTSEESRLLAGGEGVEAVGLRVAEVDVGELRYRAHGEPPEPGTVRTVATLAGLEMERSRSPEWASEEAVAEFVHAVLEGRITGADDAGARAAELGMDLGAGAGVVIGRATPNAAQSGDWRARVLTVVRRGLGPAAMAALREAEAAEVAAIVPARDDQALARAAEALEREMAASLPSFTTTVARSRVAGDAGDLRRAGMEATLAANVAAADGLGSLAFEDSGSYRLLLGAMSEDPGELGRFYEETVAPLAAYDQQYETDLVGTVEAYLHNDGNVTPTAEQLFTHRHTIRYRLERVRELCGHDISSSDGRERLSLGLKAMRVLGIAAPSGPAHEAGAKAGKVPRGDEG